ncbi:MAG: hypothetical protein IJX76_00390 [Clostridia bacterium]|nr:hypothetical protein [Clostridia bacterium]
MTISEKVAYLKGLMEGLSLPADTPEGKVLACMADILSDMALTVEDLEKETVRLGDYVEELDEDLGDVEEYLFTEDEDDDADEVEEEEDADDFFDDDDDEESDEDIYALECPSCGETIYLDESLLDETDILCPACHEPISFDIEEEDEEIEDPDLMDSVPECEKPAFNYESSD